MGNISHIIHKNSSERNTGNNGPKIPEANDIEYGEIAINYDKGNETLFIKNNEDEIVGFVNENKHNSLKETVNSNYREFETEQGKVRTNTQDIDTLKSSVSELSGVKTQISDITTKIYNLGSIEEVTKSELLNKKNDSKLDANFVYKITDYADNGNRVLYVRPLTSNKICGDAVLKTIEIKEFGGTFNCIINIVNDGPKIVWMIDNKSNEYYFDKFDANVKIDGSNNIIYKNCTNIVIKGNNNIIHNNCSDISMKGSNNTIHSNCKNINTENGGTYNYITIDSKCNRIKFYGENLNNKIGKESTDLKFENCNDIILQQKVTTSNFIRCNNVNINSGERIKLKSDCNNITMLGWVEGIYLNEGCSGNIFQGNNNNISLENNNKDNVFSPGVNYITSSDTEKSYNFIYPGVSQKQLTDSHKIIGMMRDDPS